VTGARAARLHVERLGARGQPILFVHGSMSWGEATWGAQRPLASRWRLRFVDRRGFGSSAARDEGVDFELDALDVAALLEAEPAHLVGHSYGAVVTLLAAAGAPGSVRSLTVIEPPAFGIARGDPIVDRFSARMRRLIPPPPDTTEEAFRAAFLGAMGFDRPRLAISSDVERRSIRASMSERGPEEADIPLAALRSAPFPKLVVRGAWDGAPPAARTWAGAALASTARVLAAAIAAGEAVFQGATHSPQALGAPFNARLETFATTGR
jgi:pimeloyl-ACP methyl ester carboxylesterase